MCAYPNSKLRRKIGNILKKNKDEPIETREKLVNSFCNRFAIKRENYHCQNAFYDAHGYNDYCEGIYRASLYDCQKIKKKLMEK